MEEKTYRIEKCDGKVQWDEFVLEHGGHPMQLWGWGDARATLGWQVDRLFVVEEDKQIGAVQLLVKRLTRPFGLSIYVPHGPIILENKTAVYERLITYVKENYRGVALIIEPNDNDAPEGTGWQECAIHALPAHTMTLDLTKPGGVLLAETTPEVREHIREVAQENLTMRRIGNPADIAACYALYKEACNEQGQKPHRERYFHTLHDKLGEFSAIFGAYDGEELLAFIWLALSESVAVELYSGVAKSTQDGWADYGLRWDVIRRVKEWGIPSYDLGDEAYDEEGRKHGFGTALVDRKTFVLPLSPFYNLWQRASRNRTKYAS